MRRLAPTLLVLLLLTAGCGDEPTGDAPGTPDRPSGPDASPSWGATIAYEAGHKLGGCAAGDLDPAHPGDEILAVAVTGDVHLIRHDDDGWHGEVVAQAGGEMISCAIGDADPTRPGNEAVIGGMVSGTEDDGGAGAMHLLFRDDAGWHLEPVFEDTALVHGVCIGDVVPAQPGHEVVGVGFSRKATVLGRTGEGWKELGSSSLSSPGKNAAMRGNKIYVACAGGLFDEITLEGGAWHRNSPDVGPVGPARLAVHGNRVLLACDDGGLRLLRPDETYDEGRVQQTVIHQEAQKLRGAVLADVDPSVEGVEAATAGYEKTLTLLYAPAEGGTAWTAKTLWRDTARFHHLAAGDVLPDAEGLELVAVGYSGRVIVASRRGAP